MNAHIKLKSNKKQQNTNRKHKKKKQKSRKSDSYKNFFIKLANTYIYIYIIYEYITTIKSKLKQILNASRTHRQKEQDNNNFS